MTQGQTTNLAQTVFPSISASGAANAMSNIYLVLQPWDGSGWANTEAAKCDISSFTNIVKVFQSLAHKFATAVGLSVKTARDGILLAGDSLMFLSAIGQERNNDYVLSYFQGLLKIGKNSLDNARKCEKDFREIYSSIIGIGNSIPKVIRAVKEHRLRLEKDVRRRALAAGRYQEGLETFPSWTPYIAVLQKVVR